MPCVFEKSVDRAVVTVTGTLTAGDVEELRSLLIKALIDADRVELDAAKVTAADLSCLQLLCSAHRSAVRLNKVLTLAGGLSKALKEAAESAGYLRHIGCRLDREKDCLWVARAKGSGA